MESVYVIAISAISFFTGMYIALLATEKLNEKSYRLGVKNGYVQAIKERCKK